MTTQEVRFKLVSGGKLEESALLAAFREVRFTDTKIMQRPNSGGP